MLKESDKDLLKFIFGNGYHLDNKDNIYVNIRTYASSEGNWKKNLEVALIDAIELLKDDINKITEIVGESSR